MELVAQFGGQRGNETSLWEVYRDDHDLFRFYFGTLHAHFTREQIMAAMYALNKGAKYVVTSVCKDCPNGGRIEAIHEAKRHYLLLGLGCMGKKQEIETIKIDKEVLNDGLIAKLI